LFGAWETTLKNARVRVFELTNNRALGDEGRKQRHCVFGYTYACTSGYCRIVSMRWLSKLDASDGSAIEFDRLTLEIRTRDRAIVQIRGKLNRRATNEEMAVVKQWAGAHGLLVLD
jgi:hypothetical protein